MPPRAVGLAPRAVGVPSVTWTAGPLAGYLVATTGVVVDQQTALLDSASPSTPPRPRQSLYPRQGPA